MVGDVEPAGEGDPWPGRQKRFDLGSPLVHGTLWSLGANVLGLLAAARFGRARSGPRGNPGDPARRAQTGARAVGRRRGCRRRGRGFGVAAVVIAAVGPFLYGITVGAFVIAGIAAGAS